MEMSAVATAKIRGAVGGVMQYTESIDQKEIKLVGL